MYVITVPASSGGTHTIRKAESGVWVCSCPDHLNRAKGKRYVCKHIAKLVRSLAKTAVPGEKSKRAAEILGA